MPKLLTDVLPEQVVDKSPDELVLPATQGSYLWVGSLRRGSFDRAAKAIGQPGFHPH